MRTHDGTRDGWSDAMQMSGFDPKRLCCLCSEMYAIGPKRTCVGALQMSAFKHKADIHYRRFLKYRHIAKTRTASVTAATRYFSKPLPKSPCGMTTCAAAVLIKEIAKNIITASVIPTVLNCRPALLA